MHDVAPSAVTIAVAIDAINCTINLTVSFLLIIFSFFLFFILLGKLPSSWEEGLGVEEKKNGSIQ